MANVVNNFFVNGMEVKNIVIRKSGETEWKKLKELYYDSFLIWKNANPFIFTTLDPTTMDLSNYGEDTLIFYGFSAADFTGSYTLTENIEDEVGERGQMFVENKEE